MARFMIAAPAVLTPTAARSSTPVVRLLVEDGDVEQFRPLLISESAGPSSVPTWSLDHP